MKRITLILVITLLYVGNVYSQETFQRNDVLDERAGAYAIVNAHIVASPGEEYENGVLIIRDGIIESVGSNLTVPTGYIQIDAKGNYVYPSLIDIYSSYGMPEIKKERPSWTRREQITSSKEGAYNSNEAIKSEMNASEMFEINDKEAAKWRKAGFGAVLTFNPDGIARGTSAFVTLKNDTENEVMLVERASANYSFDKGSSKQDYPRSPMGSIAVLRQTYMDAQWYNSLNPKPFADISLDSWLESQSLPQIFETQGWLTALRADKVGDEFGVQYIIKGGGDEYQRMDEVKSTSAKFIIPVNYPEAYDVEDPMDAESVSLRDMKHWELAPANPAFLEQGGLQFAITSHGLKKKSDFLDNIRTAVDYGLSENGALKAITITPAEMIGAQNRIGSLQKGKVANFIITSDNLFESGTVIKENWIQGQRHQFEPLEKKDHSGVYQVKVDNKTYNIEVTGRKAHVVVNDTTKIDASVSIENERVTMSFSPEKGEDAIRLSGWATSETNWQGSGQLGDGTWTSWSAELTEKAEPKEKRSKKKEEISFGDVIYPFVAYGSKDPAKQETVLIQNATVWTNEEDGILKNTDVLVENGKISKIGEGLSAPKGAKVVNAEGKHLTSGVIDEHSHMGASAINDTRTNSSLVRISDVVDSEQVNLYRSLAGGVTAIQTLHGSANPIGGQSSLIKLRWGEGPSGLTIENSDRFIKFALGENVKRSRSNSSIRYPQTRMGVEQVFVDAFTNAVEYEKEWNAYNSLSSKVKATTTPPRRDLTNEAMLDIIRGRLFISCHSYVQSEINMLMSVADEFGFNVNTFTHILEGYKVADKMAEHGVAASTFSDWFNYKWEVRYAIPYNAAIMQREGVVTALNSDNSELNRRLNGEAGKAVKYGGISEEEAWKMVTLNPAKMLHLDDQTGSIKEGKDADVVVWSGHPMSIYTKAEMTMVDGTVYFSLEKDKENREYIKSERARLIQKMKDAKKNGAPTRKGGSPVMADFHCEDVIGLEQEFTESHTH